MEYSNKAKDKNIDLDKLLDECLDYFINSQPKEFNLVHRGIKSKDSLMNEVGRYLKVKKLDSETIETIKTMFIDYLGGYGKFNSLLNDEDISDIKTIAPDNIRIKKLGKRSTSDVKFNSALELNRAIKVIAIKNQVNLSAINAIQTFTDKETNPNFILRITISTEYVNSVDYAYLHIRKIPKVKKSEEILIQKRFFIEEEKDYIKALVKSGKLIIAVGAGGSGKTTLINYMLDEIPFTCSGLVIQENEELFSSVHPDLMFQKVILNKGESKIKYGLKELSINGLLIDLDYFIIGEIKGSEAFYFLNASYTGHACISSVHGNSSQDAMDKLVDYIKYESDDSKSNLLKMFAKSGGAIIFMKEFGVNEISEISKYNHNEENLDYNLVFRNHEKINDSILV